MGKTVVHIIYISIIIALISTTYYFFSRSRDSRDNLEWAEDRVRSAQEEQRVVAGKLTDARNRVAELEESLRQAEGTIADLELVAGRLDDLFSGSAETLGYSDESLERIRRFFEEGDQYNEERKASGGIDRW